MRHERLTSLDLHLRYPPGAILETRCLEDTACGIYPCYYRRQPDRLLVSTWAAALIVAAGDLELNPGFRPREYLQGGGARPRMVRATAALPKAARELAKRWLPAPVLRALSRDRYWYASWETLDRRVRKLRPFERVTPTGATDRFQPDFALRDPEHLVVGVAAHLVRFTREIEAAFPAHHHVLMVGGRDSQLLTLIPKAHPERWHVFSAAPNYPRVCAWLAENRVPVGRVIGHDNRNDETPADTEAKLVAGDLYSDPRHQRWLPALRRLAAEFDGACCFWAGSAADALHVGRPHHRRYLRGDPRGFFDLHRTRVPSFVGNYHQVVKQFTGCPLLCPYQSEAIWRDVYLHHGPGVIPPGEDLRPRIGARLVGRPIRWDAANPAPAPYRYAAAFRAREIYLRYLQARRGGVAA